MATRYSRITEITAKDSEASYKTWDL